MVGNVEANTLVEAARELSGAELPKVVVKVDATQSSLPPPSPCWQIEPHKLCARKRLARQRLLDLVPVIRPRNDPDVVRLRSLTDPAPADTWF
jgi:hypothetical protein